MRNLPDLNAASCPAGCGEYSGPEKSRLFPGRFGPKSPSRELGRRRQAGIFPENPNNPAGPEGPVNGAEPPPIHHGGRGRTVPLTMEHKVAPDLVCSNTHGHTRHGQKNDYDANKQTDDGVNGRALASSGTALKRCNHCRRGDRQRRRQQQQ